MENRRLYCSFVTRLKEKSVVGIISRLSAGSFRLQKRNNFFIDLLGMINKIRSGEKYI